MIPEKILLGIQSPEEAAQIIYIRAKEEFFKWINDHKYTTLLALTLFQTSGIYTERIRLSGLFLDSLWEIRFKEDSHLLIEVISISETNTKISSIKFNKLLATEFKLVIFGGAPKVQFSNY
ncbi:hypothetical protein HNR42_002497 [Deinobacterium chartae]|uniref:Uncharacterized protein n=1 Tax=Deinobacterium chartae TaxID=521158 RepID=A0A841HZV7_9DEIO|nr:hypothetical protein [Deinobacterium chartae]MBB6099061.1 hypothetical protein [Deinobacterium chartae]